MLGRIAMFQILQRIQVALPPTRARVWACILALAGSPAYYFCQGHVCIGGHMKHPPYPFIDHVGDSLWIMCFSIAFGLAGLSNLRWRLLMCIFIAFLFFTRFGLVRFTFAEPGSLPLELFHAERPVQAAMCFYAVVGLLGFRIKRPMRELVGD